MGAPIGSKMELVEKNQIMSSKITPEKVQSLRHELTQIRQASLHATRNGDFMRVARLTPRAAQINKAIMDAEAQMIADL